METVILKLVDCKLLTGLATGLVVHIYFDIVKKTYNLMKYSIQNHFNFL